MSFEEEASESAKIKAGRSASKVLHFLVTNKNLKLKLAKERRKRLTALISQGKSVSNDSRYNWIKDMSGEVFGWLAEQAELYEKQNPHDVVLGEDLYDVLRNAQKRLHAKLEEIEKENQESESLENDETKN